MTSDRARQRAERSFKKEERTQDGRKAMTEYEVQGRATREKTERLKALRLAKGSRGAEQSAGGVAGQAQQAAPRASREITALCTFRLGNNDYAQNSTPATSRARGFSYSPLDADEARGAIETEGRR
jgi:hypothetical protein